jgi:hypothetical protein
LNCLAFFEVTQAARLLTDDLTQVLALRLW